MTGVPASSHGSGGSQGTELGYDQITTTVNIASTTEATPTTLIACAAHTFDGAPVLLTVFGYFSTGSVAVSQQILLFEGATEITRLGQIVLAAAAVDVFAVTYLYRFTPTAAAHTYTIAGFANSVAGTAPFFGGGVGGTGAVSPAFARFTKV